MGSLEFALNRYLSLDKQVEDLLAPIAGKVIALEITPINAYLYLCPTEHSIQILESYHQRVDASLTGSLAAFGFMGVSATPMHTLYKGEVRIAGDMEVARKFQNLFSKLDIDLQSHLAEITGPVTARKIYNWLENSRKWSRNSLLTFKLNVEEFLQEETRELPAKPEAEYHFQAVDICRSDVDRLEARLLKLSTRITQENLTGNQS
jgi:ubiquinone biosynthesis protein UbiJ